MMNRFKFKLLLTMMLVMGLFALIAAGRAQAYAVKQSWARISVVAGETLAPGDLVAIKAADGLAWKASSGSATLRPAIGIVGTKSGTVGQSVEIIIYGIVSGWTALSPGGAAYMGTAGAITQSAPAYSQQVGFAISATEYLINCRSYLDTSSLTALGTLTGATPLVLEGATANSYQTTLAVTDPTAARTFTIPDASGTVSLTGTNGAASHDYSAGTTDWTLSALEAEAGYLATTNAGGAINAIMSSCRSGKYYTVNNTSGQTVTFKVTGQTGGTVATAKVALFICTGTDLVRIYTQP